MESFGDKRGTKAARAHLGRVLVLGLGISGKSVARYCASLLGSRVDELFIAAGAKNDDSLSFVESLAGEGVSWAFGDDALASASGRFDICVASPGIPFWHELYRAGRASSEELMSEVEFAWRESAADSVWVAITGTNGKTTTTSLAAHVLRECGFAARPVGNIGEVCLDAVAAGETDVYVAEVSSYQLYSTIEFAPDIAVELNITPDHLHWHQTLEAYRDAKLSMLDHLAGASSCASASRGDNHGSIAATRPIAVLDAANDVVRRKVRELRKMDDDERGFDYIPMGTADGMHGDMRARCGAENAAFISDDGVLTVAFGGREHALATCGELQVKGSHNAWNALAASCIAVALGADDALVSQALKTFRPLEHRIEPCGMVDGVECFNDSKATNVDAAAKALEAFRGQRVIVLLGGDDKGTDLSELVDAVHARACAAVCFGAAGPRIAQALEQRSENAEAGFTLVRAGKLGDAFDKALELAEPGDAVLLSPACASFDEFKSFEERGRVFKGLVSSKTEG